MSFCDGGHGFARRCYVGRDWCGVERLFCGGGELFLRAVVDCAFEDLFVQIIIVMGLQMN